ncbi:putative peptidase S10, serine carboxypeptidase, alpha/Beta hydrolase [Helianthus annuus]|nr:putative peptidase S10, serine carboxypeptidase, alpha/Beta hydrolase [Helianthus annuus]
MWVWMRRKMCSSFTTSFSQSQILTMILSCFGLPAVLVVLPSLACYLKLMASIIFLDLPVGTGFSYARTIRASHSMDIQLCDQAYEFMRKWFKSYPEFTSNPFYVGGDSYSGNPVPIITQLISDGGKVGLLESGHNLDVVDLKVQI